MVSEGVRCFNIFQTLELFDLNFPMSGIFVLSAFFAAKNYPLPIILPINYFAKLPLPAQCGSDFGRIIAGKIIFPNIEIFFSSIGNFRVFRVFCGENSSRHCKLMPPSTVRGEDTASTFFFLCLLVFFVAIHFSNVWKLRDLCAFARNDLIAERMRCRSLNTDGRG